MLVSAVRVMSTPELVGVHAKGGGEEGFGFCTQSDMQRMEVEAERVRWGMGRKEVGLLYLSGKKMV